MYKIYEIRCNETDEVYIGKTIRTLRERLYDHKHLLDCSSKQIILRGDFVMSQINECDTEEESIEIEARYIRNTDNCVNIHIPGRTLKEWWENNKDEIKIKQKEYYEAHKDEILEYAKEYREKNREYFIEYREAHKDKIKKKRKEKYTCDCGSTLTVGSKSKHEKTHRHLLYIKK